MFESRYLDFYLQQIIADDVRRLLCQHRSGGYAVTFDAAPHVQYALCILEYAGGCDPSGVECAFEALTGGLSRFATLAPLPAGPC